MKQKVCVNTFLFNSDRSEVLLILKNRPAWQVGKFNGIGGKLEEEESPFTGALRETFEECGINVPETDLKEFCCLRTSNFIVYFFAATLTEELYRSFVPDKTDEKVVSIPLAKLENTISNLLWLIPMALNYLDTNKPTDYHTIYER